MQTLRSRLGSAIRFAKPKLPRSLLGCEPTVLHQRDTFFQANNGRLKLREIDPGTTATEAQLIQYVRDDDPKVRVSDYVISPVADPETMIAALEKSLGVRGVVEKKRRLWIVGQTRIHFDSVVGLGEFVELEFVLKDGQNQAEGHAVVADLMTQLEIVEADVVPCAYIDLIEQTDSCEKNE